MTHKKWAYHIIWWLKTGGILTAMLRIESLTVRPSHWRPVTGVTLRLVHSQSLSHVASQVAWTAVTSRVWWTRRPGRSYKDRELADRRVRERTRCTASGYSIDTEHQAPLVSALAGRSCWYVHLRVERRRMRVILEGCVECVGSRYCWCILLSFDDVHIHFALSSHQSVSGSLCPRAAAIK